MKRGAGVVAGTGVGVVSVLLYLAGLGNIEQSTYDAADIDGCGWVRTSKDEPSPRRCGEFSPIRCGIMPRTAAPARDIPCRRRWRVGGKPAYIETKYVV